MEREGIGSRQTAETLGFFLVLFCFHSDGIILISPTCRIRSNKKV